jgi:hypothetical protein
MNRFDKRVWEQIPDEDWLRVGDVATKLPKYHLTVIGNAIARLYMEGWLVRERYEGHVVYQRCAREAV